ncbi:MAG: DUF370 domain-containing protein [Oscillospiraceae bacterium]|nr:DUF370 domain-containing protein [Oscillospiraceae bacterium]
MQILNVGFGNIVLVNRIISIVSPESAPLKRLVQEAKDNKTAIDATHGRKTRSVLIMDSGNVILSSVQPETIASRLESQVGYQKDESEEETQNDG